MLKPKEHYQRHSITIPEQLAKQYAKMSRSEILLHQYILSIVDEQSIVKRNISAAARELGCSRSWLYTAETSLIMRELLSLNRRNSTRFWKVVDIKDEVEASPSLVSETPAIVDDETEVPKDDAEKASRSMLSSTPNGRGFFSWLRKASSVGRRRK